VVFTLISVVVGVVASVPLAPDELLATYRKAAKELPGGGVSYEQLVAVDAVRFRQDFSQVTPATIAETRDLFKHCTAVEDPETGHEEWKCSTRSFDDVMTDLRFTPEDREFVRQLVMSLTPRPRFGDGGGFAFTPQGPYTWPIDAYLITSEYGAREDPVTGEEGFHTGVDIAAPVGMPVMAAATGTVTMAGEHGNFGKAVMLNNGGFRTLYGHLSIVIVERGQVVSAGEVIGYSGNTGKSTGPHLHFEWVTDGLPVDPLLCLSP